jgi:predicted cupin superfamily sugar epimerase
MNKQDLIKHLSLIEHIEGGYFYETHRSQHTVNTEREGKERSTFTSIYYLLTDDRPIDYFHRNRSDIMHYFQLGSPITYLILTPEGKLTKVKLGMNLELAEVPQLLVPGGFWKTAFLEAGEFGLIGEAVAPGFDYRDMEIAKKEIFKEQFPDLWSELKPYIQH